MFPQIDILTLARRQPVMQEQLQLLHEKNRLVPGSVQYSINRFRKETQWNIDDTGMLVYHYSQTDSSENYLELQFCVSGYFYCKQKDSECDFCKLNASRSCSEKVDSVDVLRFSFKPSYLTQFTKGKKSNLSLTDEVLRFKHTRSFSKQLPLCSKTRMVIEALLNHSYTGSMENIFINAQTQMLLLNSMDCMLGEKEETFTCKFLANEEDRQKIIKAREVLLQHIGEPITIKELSRKAAINECYLKKGFKEIFGTTIFDFYQTQRMEHAKYLLYEKGLSVTEVSLLLGYSSISHFSTAFKKHTGIKPCELLVH